MYYSSTREIVPVSFDISGANVRRRLWIILSPLLLRVGRVSNSYVATYCSIEMANEVVLV
jgi:hypothetical protein